MTGDGVVIQPRGSRPSLAVRMGIAYAISAFALVLLVVVILYTDVEKRLAAEDDQFVVDNIGIVVELLREQPVDEEALEREVVWEWAARRHHRVYVRLTRGDGFPTRETLGMTEILPASGFPTPVAWSDDHALAVDDRRVPDGTPFRVAAARVDIPNLEPAVVQVALDVSQESRLLAGLRVRLLTVLAAAFVACGLVGYAVARRGLRPVRQMATAVGRIHPNNLGERLDRAKLPTELASLATTFNEMLYRLEESFARLSRFSADLAHELRTPVHILRGEVEVALSRKRSTEEYREVLESCLEECVRLSELIDRLLFLARANDPRTCITRERVNLTTELAALRDFFEAAATERAVTIRVVGADVVEGNVDRMLFQRALGNLLSNALAYTPRGGNVEIEANRTDGKLVVRVSDDGAGIPAEAQARVFERFFRVDFARSGRVGGAGLGLAIVKSIMTLHGGDVSLSSELGRGTTVELRFPAR